MNSGKKYYNSIDNCPIDIFQKILQTGDIQLLGKGSRPVLKRVWESIFDEYIKEFGLPENYLNYLKAKTRAMQMYNSAYNEGKKHMLNFARVEEIKAKEAMQSDAGTPTFMESVAHVSKYMGFRIDVSIVTVREYYNYLKIMSTNG